MGSASKGSKQQEKKRDERRQAKRRKREERRAPNGLHKRSVEKREERKRFLLVCEGEKTEPNYFDQFPVDKQLVKIQIEGCGKHTRLLVEKAIQIRDKAAKNSAFDEVWVVFDRDSFDPSDFNDALRLARKEKIYTAYTNEAFELWFLLHFNYSEASLSRKTYKARLTKALGAEYRKNDEGMYLRLRPCQPTAIRNAMKLWAKYEGSHNPEKDNPCTSVHLLVCKLNQQRSGALPDDGCWCGLDNKLCLGPNPEKLLCRAT